MASRSHWFGIDVISGQTMESIEFDKIPKYRPVLFTLEGLGKTIVNDDDEFVRIGFDIVMEEKK